MRSRKAHFDAEIAPVTVQDRKGERVVATGRNAVHRATSRRFPTLKPAFGKDGTVTAASSSSISDGAAALVVLSGAAAARSAI